MSSAPARAPRRAPAGGWPQTGSAADPQVTAPPKAAETPLDSALAPENPAQAPVEEAPAPAPRSLPPATGNGPRPAPRTSAPRAAAATPPTTPAPSRRRLLPDGPTDPVTDLALQKIFLYGRGKIGKSTFAAQFPDVVIARCEDGLNALRVAQVPIDDWATFIEFCGEIKAGGHGYRTVVVDTVDILYGFCKKAVLDKYKVTHESDLDWGKGWSVVSDEFQIVLSHLALQGVGLVFISHSELSTIKPKNAPEYTRIVPTCSKKAWEFLSGFVDHILFLDTAQTQNGESRALYCAPTELVEAGSRWSMPPALWLPNESTMYADFAKEYDAAVARRFGGVA